MKKLNKKQILFIDPFFSFLNRNTAGIACLRGHLKESGIDSSAINLNNLINENLSDIYYKQIFNILKESKGEDHLKNLIDFNQFSSNKFLIIHKLLYTLGVEKIWDSVSRIDALNDIFEKIAIKYPNMQYLCISITFNAQMFTALVISCYMKNIFGDKLKIIFGGNLITGHVDDVKQLLEFNKIVDFFVVGEGEDAIYSIIQENKFSRIPNLVYLQDEKYKSSFKKGIVKKNNSLATPLYENDDYIYLQVTKKCYWSRCSYCVYEKYSHARCFETKSPQKVVKDILSINSQKRKKNQECHFVDACLPPVFLKKFSKLIITNSRIKNSFKTFLRCDKGFSYDILKLARDAGFFLFMLGPETLSPRLLKVINKGHNREDVYKMIDNCHKLGIYLSLNFIVYLPTQTKEELIQDLTEIKKLLEKYYNIVSVRLAKFQVRPESEIYHNPKKFNIKLLKSKDDFLSHTIEYQHIHDQAMTHEEFNEVVWGFYEKYLKKFRVVKMLFSKNKK